MDGKVYTFKLGLDWNLINEISRIDRFGGSWSDIEKRESQSLKQLKSIATVRSVGASTRIEGSKMTDAEVETLIKNLQVSKLEERDEQEVAGYFDTLDIIAESYRDIAVSENGIKTLHNLLMKYSKKDEWHKGGYKQLPNAVEATNPNGSKYIIFRTAEPGVETEDAMRNLVEWYNTDKETHPIVRAALFVYDFISIHPFQDGNGRLSRLLGTLLLLKENYTWIQYVSFEHEIESRKAEYYKVLMECQRQRPGEPVDSWIMLFLDCMSNIQRQLMDKLQRKGVSTKLSPREKKVYTYIESHPGSKSGEIAQKLNIPLPTVKRILSSMVSSRLLGKYGEGAGINYTIEPIDTAKNDRVYRLIDQERRKDITLVNPNAHIEIKKIVLTPLFPWTKPDEWAGKLVNQGLYLKITYNFSRSREEMVYSIDTYNNPYYFQPVFSLNSPIIIPLTLSGRMPNDYEYPFNVSIELCGSAAKFDFDVMLVYDEIFNEGSVAVENRPQNALDKKISLLEKDLNSISPEIRTQDYFNEDTFFRMYDNSITRLLRAIIPVGQKFNRLFEEQRHGLYVISDIGMHEFTDESAEDLIQELRKQMVEKKDILRRDKATFNFAFQYNKLKNEGTIRTHYSIMIEMEDIEYYVTRSISAGEASMITQIPKRKYHIPMSDREIKDIEDKMGKSIAEAIAEEMKKKGIRK